MVSADNKESAVQIANKHGLLVDSTMPVAEAAPEPPKIVNKKLDDRIEDILSSEDEDLPGGLDDLDLDDDVGRAPASPGSPSTKSCPYCGEQILAVAVKCKHCGSYVGEKAAKPRQPSGDAPSQGVPMRVWAIVGGAVAIVVIVPIVIILVWVMWGGGSAPSVAPPLPEPVVVAPPPAPPDSLPKPAIYKPSSEEMAYAAKLVAFLDGCDELTRLLEKGAKVDQLNKQSEVIKLRQAAIPRPPQGVSWAQQADQSSKQLFLVVSMVASRFAGQDVLEELLKQSAGSTPDNSAAYRQLADEVRKLVTPIRGLIPPECLAKPK
jgi:hypothetical protein